MSRLEELISRKEQLEEIYSSGALEVSNGEEKIKYRSLKEVSSALRNIHEQIEREKRGSQSFKPRYNPRQGKGL